MIRKLAITPLFLFTIFCAFAQNGGEILVGVTSTPATLSTNQARSSKNSVELPFFDDFSRGLSYPTESLWENRNVLVNTAYAINSRTTGVATFDAIGSDGNLYPNLSIYQSAADTLTSNSVNLNFPGDTTIYLTFWYQPQGNGNQPQTQDSLILDFYDSSTGNWENVWSASVDFSQNKLDEENRILPNRSTSYVSDTLNRTFHMVHFPITGERFLSENFQFRFRNLASLPENTHVPGLRGNSDHWNIDIVWLDRQRTYKDTILNDITFYKPMESILNSYQSIPWKHFDMAQENEINDPLTFTVFYQNLGNQTWNVTRRFSIKNLSNNDVYNFSQGAENIFPYSRVELFRNFLYDFTSIWPDSAKFEYTSYLITDFNPETYHLRWNDTIRYVQEFKNYYSYDDGTAESGYGLYGEGTQNGMVAVKFTNYKPDLLVAVNMYFNRTYNDANQKYFRLRVWGDNNGKPGELLYEQLGLRPSFSDELNKYESFELEDSLWLDAGTFYIGWMQTTTDMLNVGFDQNQNSSSKLFYNISGQWVNTQFEGSLMLRPVFGEIYGTPTAIPTNEQPNDFNIFPNPASCYFQISTETYAEKLSVKIFNLAGQLVKSQDYGTQVDISNLPSGTYIVRIIGSKIFTANKKLIIAR